MAHFRTHVLRVFLLILPFLLIYAFFMVRPFFSGDSPPIVAGEPPAPSVAPSPVPSPALSSVASQAGTEANVQAAASSPALPSVASLSDTEVKVQEIVAKYNGDQRPEGVKDFALELEPYGPSAKAAILPLLIHIRRNFTHVGYLPMLPLPGPDPSNPHLQEAVRVLKTIDPNLMTTFDVLYGEYAGLNSLQRAYRLDFLRLLQPDRERALRYYQQELDRLSPQDYYVLEAVVRGALMFGIPNPESRIPLSDRLASPSEFIRERAHQEFRSLPNSTQEGLVRALKDRWTALQPGKDPGSLDLAQLSVSLAARASADWVLSRLQPGTYLIDCHNCLWPFSTVHPDANYRISQIMRIQSAEIVSDTTEPGSPWHITVRGQQLIQPAPSPAKTNVFYAKNETRCFEPSSEAPRDARSKGSDSPAFVEIDIRFPGSLAATLYPYNSSADAPQGNGTPLTEGDSFHPAKLVLLTHDLKKLAACVQLQQEAMLTSQSILASIKAAGGTIVSDSFEGRPAKDSLNSGDGLFGFVTIEPQAATMRIHDSDLTPDGLQTMRSFCGNPPPSLFLTSYVVSGDMPDYFTGFATCVTMGKEKNSSDHILSLKLSGPITQIHGMQSNMFLSRKPFPHQTWRTRPPSPEERQQVNEQANRHLGALGRLNPATYEFHVIEARDGRQVIVLPIYERRGPNATVVYLVLTKVQGVWKPLYGFEHDSFNLWADLDGDGFPEFTIIVRDSNSAVWRMLPEFKRLFQRR